MKRQGIPGPCARERGRASPHPHGTPPPVPCPGGPGHAMDRLVVPTAPAYLRRMPPPPGAREAPREEDPEEYDRSGGRDWILWVPR